MEDNNIDCIDKMGLIFSELKENIRSLDKPPNSGICSYDTALIVIQLDLKDGF